MACAAIAIVVIADSGPLGQSDPDLRTVLNAGVAEAVPNLGCLDKQVSVRNRCKAQGDKRRLIRVALSMPGDEIEKGRFCRSKRPQT